LDAVSSLIRSNKTKALLPHESSEVEKDNKKIEKLQKELD